MLMIIMKKVIMAPGSRNSGLDPDPDQSAKLIEIVFCSSENFESNPKKQNILKWSHCRSLTSQPPSF